MPKPKTKQETIKNLKAIYQTLEKKNLPEHEFVKQMLDVMDPKKMISDLEGIELQKARERLNRLKIQNAVKRSGG